MQKYCFRESSDNTHDFQFLEPPKTQSKNLAKIFLPAAGFIFKDAETIKLFQRKGMIAALRLKYGLLNSREPLSLIIFKFIFLIILCYLFFCMSSQGRS